MVVFGKVALTCQEYLRKGRQLYVEGRLRYARVGKQRFGARRTEIFASRIQFLGIPSSDAKADEPLVEGGLASESDIPF